MQYSLHTKRDGRNHIIIIIITSVSHTVQCGNVAYNQDFIVWVVPFLPFCSLGVEKKPRSERKEALRELGKEVEKEFRESRLVSYLVSQLKICTKSATGTSHEIYPRG